VCVRVCVCGYVLVCSCSRCVLLFHGGNTSLTLSLWFERGSVPHNLLMVVIMYLGCLEPAFCRSVRVCVCVPKKPDWHCCCWLYVYVRVCLFRNKPGRLLVLVLDIHGFVVADCVRVYVLRLCVAVCCVRVRGCVYKPGRLLRVTLGIFVAVRCMYSMCVCGCCVCARVCACPWLCMCVPK
jgi:hypothetical protein